MSVEKIIVLVVIVALGVMNVFNFIDNGGIQNATAEASAGCYEAKAGNGENVQECEDLNIFEIITY